MAAFLLGAVSVLLAALALLIALALIPLGSASIVVCGVSTGEVVLPLLATVLALPDALLVALPTALPVVLLAALLLSFVASGLSVAPVSEQRRLVALRAVHDVFGSAGTALPAAGPFVALIVLVALFALSLVPVARSAVVVTHG